MKQKRADRLDNHLGTHLRQLRTRKGLSMAQMGEIIDVTPQQISRYESGQHRLTASALYRLARGLDMPLSWFFEYFEESADELKRVRNIVRESRGEWRASSKNDQTATLISLWQALPKENQRQQIIHLLEVFT